MSLFLDGAAICFGLVGVLFVAFVAWGVYARRHETLPDPEGVRTVATFRGGPFSDEERERIAEEGPASAGGDMLRALVDALAQEGVETADSPSPGDHGWAVSLADGEAYLEVGLLLRTGEVDEALESDGRTSWLLMLLETSGGGPGPRKLLPPIHRALQRLPEVDTIEWFARHRFGEHEDDGAPYPLDDEVAQD